MDEKELFKLSDKQLSEMDANSLVDETTEKKKLTDWKNEPSLSDLKNDFNQASQSQSGIISKIKEWERLYDAPKFGNDKHRGSRVTPKLVRKQAEWNVPALTEPFLSTTNLYDVKPVTFDDVHRAKQTGLILNRQFNTQLGKIKLVNGIIRRVVKYGTAIVRLGWDYQTKEVIEPVEQFEYRPIQPSQEPSPEQQAYEQLTQIYQQLTQLRALEPDSYEQQPSELKAGFEMSEEKGELIEATSIGFKKEKVKKVISNKPTVELCNIKNVYIDPTCEYDFDKAQFIVHSYQSSLSDLKRSGLYRNLDNIIPSNDVTPFDYDNRDDTFRFADKARKKLIVYEYWGYWDIDGSGITKPIVACWVGDTLIRLEENPFPDGKLPFVVFNYIPGEDSVYGIPNAELLGDNQEILGAVTRGMIDLMGKSANSQTGFTKNFLDSTNKMKFLKGMDYEYNQGFDPRIHVYTHKYPEIPNSALTMVQMMNNEAESLSGVKAFSGTGISASNLGDVAVGVRGVLDAVSKREMSILRLISDGFITLGRKIISMDSEFLEEKEVVRVTNNQFVTIRKDDLAGEFDLTLTISTAEGDESKAQQLAFLMQTIGNSMGQGLTQKILAEIATLRKMPDLAKEIESYQEQPDEIQQQMQQLQMQLLQAQIALTQAQAQEASAKAEVNGAKVGVEQARANNLQGDADNKTLDFMERDTGAKHLRELEKQDAVNQGIMGREQIKADSQLQNQSMKQHADLFGKLAQGDIDERLAQQQQMLSGGI